MAHRDLIERLVDYADARGAGDLPLETEIAGFSVLRRRACSLYEGTLYRPLFCLVLQGAKEAMLGTRPVRFAAGQSLIVSLEMPTLSRIVEASRERPYVGIALALELDMIRDLHAQLEGTEVAVERAEALVAGATDPALVDAMGRLFDLVERPRERRVLAPLLVREIHFRLLLAPHGGMLRRLALRDSHASRLTGILSQIRRDFTKPLKVPELARAAGMSPSSFHEHFKRLTATTPLQYQKDLRLMEARRRLLEGELSVSEVAFGVGYESPTQFSREYARRFGTPPSGERATAAA